MTDTTQMNFTPKKVKGRIPLVWPALGAVLGWGLLVTQLRHHWGGESYYNFGFFVPFLTAWLLYRNLSMLETRQAACSPGTLLTGAACMLLVLPFHMLSEVNPFWRVPLWVQAIGLYGFTLTILHSIYGKAGIRAGIFPLFFLLTMIPWPYRIEVFLIQALTKVVVTAAMWGIHFLGYPVELAGNSLVLGDLQIGVNEACSGIRSLQALFMVTLFLGSLFGQDKTRRLLAVLLLPLIVVLINSLRAVFLSLQVITKGDTAYHAWHDTAGYIAFGVSMVLIYGCIELLNMGSATTDEPDRKPVGVFLQGFLIKRGTRAMALFAVMPLLAYSLVEGWFLWHEKEDGGNPDWSLQAPDPSDPAIRYLEIHPQISGVLGYSYGQRFLYRPSSRLGYEVYYYGYEADNKLASVSSYGHSPTICMEAVGASMIEEYPTLFVDIGPVSLPLRHFLFQLDKGKGRLHVFWVVWEKRNQGIPPEQLASLDYMTQVQQLLRGRRDFSRKVLLLSASGVREETDVRQNIQDLLAEWVVPESAP